MRKLSQLSLPNITNSLPKKMFLIEYFMILARNLLISVLVLYCCYMVFKISSKAGFFFIPLLFVLPPLIFRGDKTSKDNGQE